MKGRMKTVSPEAGIYERTVCRDGRIEIEVRSPGGKLLYKKTDRGYEIKCPRTKQVCVIPYEHILEDCLRCVPDLVERIAQWKATRGSGVSHG